MRHKKVPEHPEGFDNAAEGIFQIVLVDITGIDFTVTEVEIDKYPDGQYHIENIKHIQPSRKFYLF